MTATPGHCAIYGYDFSDIIYSEGVNISGGGLSVEEITTQARNYADVRQKGRAAKKYKIRARSTERSEIETFLREVNTAPEESEFLPFDAERAGYIASAYASLQSPKQFYGGIFYEAEAEITCREAWLVGPDKGIDFGWYVALPSISALLENEGHERSSITYFQASGDYVSGSYVEDLSCRATLGTSSTAYDRDLALCDKMLRGDIFEFGWRGEIWHSYETDFSKPWAAIALDLHGKTSGGSITSEVLTLDNLDYMMIPFHGPLPVSGEAGAACLTLQVDALTGDGATIQYALETDLSDMADADHDDLVIGENIIPIPDLEGETHVAIGIKAAASGSVSLSNCKGSIKRYVAPSLIPWADPDEEFKLRVESTAGTQLRFLQVAYNDRYWY